MSSKVLLCGKCGAPVIPGALFCWRHEASPPKVGELEAQDGQLRWTSARECKGSAERLLAVLVDGRQVVVEVAREAPAERPRRVDLEVREPGKPNARMTSVTISIGTVYAAIQAGAEGVTATAPSVK